jgi:hypothetical protein
MQYYVRRATRAREAKEERGTKEMSLARSKVIVSAVVRF